MKIAILTSGILPVPAVRGGAVETHIDFYLKYNHEHKLHDITIFSIWDKRVDGHSALLSDVNHYRYVRTDGFRAGICKAVHECTHGEGYYHRSIEYYFRKAWRLIRKEKYDVILLDNRPGYAVHIDVPQGTRLVLYLHNDLLNRQTRAYRDIYDKAARIITVSDFIAGRVRTINPQDRKCITVHNGIDTDAFSSELILPVPREVLGLKEDDFVIVFSGRVVREKGVSELIEALARLKEYPSIKLLIIGSPFYDNTSNESPFIRELRQKAEQVSGRVFFTGYVKYSQMPAYLRTADIAAVPSMWEEPFGNTVVEAMAAGLPLITTRSGGIPEICEGVATIVERDNIARRLAQAILDLYRHPEKRRAMSRAALERSRLFSEERYAQDFFKALVI